MTGIDFDFSELNRFAVTIDQGNAEMAGNVAKAVGISALKGKRAWSRSAGGRRYLGAYPGSIDYDRVGKVDGAIGTDLGPNLGRPGAGLGIVEDSPGGVRGTPQRHYEKAEDVIEKDLIVGVLKAVDDALGGV